MYILLNAGGVRNLPINLKLLMQADVTRYAGMLTHKLSFHEVLTSHHGSRHLFSGMVTGLGNLARDVHLCLPTHVDE